MPPEPRNLPRLQAVARALGPLRERVVFVGGATVNLYSTTPTKQASVERDVKIALADLDTATGDFGFDAATNTANVMIQAKYPDKITTASRLACIIHTIIVAEHLAGVRYECHRLSAGPD